jgi:hypothetical protein
MEDGGWRMEDGGWRMEDGGWKRYLVTGVNGERLGETCSCKSECDGVIMDDGLFTA